MPTYKATTATHKIAALRQRIRAVAGGTSASKTVSILFWLIDYSQTHGKKPSNQQPAFAFVECAPKVITIVSETYSHLENGAMRDFQNIMKDANYWDDNRWHGTRHTYTFETGTEIQFMSVDTYGKAHGPRRDILYINEANNLDYAIADQLITRTREIVWLDWNPSAEYWFYTEMLPNRQDVDFITLTYLDNEALDPITVSEIESHKGNKNWWTVYGLGQLGEIEGRIFKGWQTIDEIPHEARLEVRGLDFGYANDPVALCDIYRYNGGYIIDELAYRTGMLNRQTADIILNQSDPNVLTIGDSAEPKSIAEMAEYGVNIVGVEKKGIGGVNFTNSAIQFVQGQKISITRRSNNFRKSYNNFMWQTDRDGKIISKYDHFMSDGMMAVVYGMTNFSPREVDEEVYTTGDFSTWT